MISDRRRLRKLVLQDERVDPQDLNTAKQVVKDASRVGRTRIGVAILATAGARSQADQRTRRSMVTATLKVSREMGFGIELRRGRFEILVDGRSVGTVDYNQSTEIAVEAGHHTLRIRKGRYSSQDRACDLTDGQVATFHCHGDRIWPTWLASFLKPDLAISLREDRGSGA